MSRSFKLFGVIVGGTSVVGFAVVYSSGPEEPKKKLVILGSGWGAVSLIKSLTPGKFDVSVVSPQNYFLFTPLLPSVTVGTVEGRSIAEPIRKMLFRRHQDAKFYEAACTRVNAEGSTVECHDKTAILGAKQDFTLEYDYLVVAVGAQTATYNIPGVKDHAYYLKDVHHAQAIRKNIIDSFETAMVPGQPEDEVKRLLHFVVVGGGPTGVEFAAELRDWIKEDLKKIYPDALINQAQITLVDGLNKILNTYSEEISRYTESNFKKEGIQIITSAFVSRLEADTLHYKHAVTKELHSMPYGMCVWCAGIGPRDLTRQIQSELPEQNNRFGLITDHFLKVKNSKNIFALGDCSTVQFKKFSEYLITLLDIYEIADDVEITGEQFRAILVKGMKKYPHMSHQFREMERSREKVVLEDGEVFSRQQLLALSNKVDAKQTSLPPTAQVAAQEGKYLGKLLTRHADDIVNNPSDDITPFQYNHLGSFAYIGDSQAVLEMPIIGSLMGWSTMWLWRGIYASEAVTLRMRTLVMFDWIKAFIFGRDTSRI